jgi:hypothetical protein
VPGADRILTSFCAPALRLRGPAAIVGFVRDPDTGVPVDSARVTLVIAAEDPLGLVKESTVREARPDATGRFRLCGLPAGLRGKLQVERKGIRSSEIPIALGAELLEPKGLSLSLANRRITVQGDSGRTRTVLAGTARLTGRVVNSVGRPIEGARVSVAGTAASAVTRANGEFILDSLPSGTQMVEVRKLAFAVAEQAVELRSYGEVPVVVTMTDHVPTLETVRSVGDRTVDLENIGYTRRKRTGGGYYYEGDQINTTSSTFSSSLSNVPSLRVRRVDVIGDRYEVTDARNSSGCVAYIVDGTKWKSVTPGDIDIAVRPEEVQALEVYHSSNVPAEFVRINDGKCLTIVIWTRRRVRPR